MRRLMLGFLGLAMVVLGAYGVATATGWDEGAIGRWVADLGRGPAGAAAIVGLLAVDVALPVPSSVVMTLAGAGWGVLGGGALSFTGALLAALIGYSAGRAGGPRAATWAGAGDPAAVAWVARYGAWAVALSRPVPVLAETTAVIAGLHGVPRARFLAGVVAGVAPTAVGYAWAGAHGEGALALTMAGGVPAAGLLLWFALRSRGR